MSDMVERARRMVAQAPPVGGNLREWAEALLAEHERADDLQQAYNAAVEALEGAVEARVTAERERDRKADYAERMNALAEERLTQWRTVEARRASAEARAEQAERERDEAWDAVAAAVARVAALEAALEKYGRHEGGCAYLRRHTRPGRPKRDGRCDCGLDAALGEQDTAGEECPDCDAPQVIDHGDGTWSCPNPVCRNFIGEQEA